MGASRRKETGDLRRIEQFSMEAYMLGNYQTEEERKERAKAYDRRLEDARQRLILILEQLPLILEQLPPRAILIVATRCVDRIKLALRPRVLDDTEPVRTARRLLTESVDVASAVCRLPLPVSDEDRGPVEQLRE